MLFLNFFFSSRRRHTILQGDWSSDVCSSDLDPHAAQQCQPRRFHRQGSSFGVTLQVNLTRANMLLDDLVQTSKRVAQTSSRRAKIDLLAALLKRATPAEIETAIAFLSGGLRQGRIGVGYATLEAARAARAADPGGGGGATPRGSLELVDVDALLERLTHTTGKGSTQAKERLLGELFAGAAPQTQEFLCRLLLGELPQGALVGLVP